MPNCPADEGESPAPQGSMVFSRADVVNSLMDKLSAKCRIESKAEKPKLSADSALERLELIKNWR